MAALIAAACAAPTLATRWGPEWATRDLTLTLTELRREKSGNRMDVVFRLNARGVPHGAKLLVWHKSRGARPQRVPGVYLADDGRLMDAQSGEETDLHAGGLARGESYDLGAADPDATLRAYVKALPFPVEAREGRRHLEAEIGSVGADVWLLTGEGFSPGENLDAVLAAGEDVHMDHLTVPATGMFTRVLFPAAVFGRPQGKAIYRVTGRGAPLELSFSWGPPALTPE